MSGPYLSRKPSQPHVAATSQQWASSHVEDSHIEALYSFGELALFTMMWIPLDAEAGRVEHCSRCFNGVAARQAKVFNQPTEKKCPVCYGTTYQGGFRAQIVRPSIWSDRNSEHTEQARGTIYTDSLQVETTGDFFLRRGDYAFRYDNSRYQVSGEKREAVLRSGFHPPLSGDSFAGPASMQLEEETSVAHIIPPTAEQLLALLGHPGPFRVGDLTRLDVVRPGGYL
jgi:hypothetical protein